MARGILSYFTRHATAANLLLVVLLAIGLASYPRMRAQFFPDVVVDDITVSVAWSGAGAEDVDNAIVEVLTPALLAVDGVEDASSTATEGRANIRLEFEPDHDMAKAAEDVQTAVDSAAGNLPEDAEDPEIRRGGWFDRVTDVVITGPVAPDQLGRFADEFVIQLYAAGVTQTTVRGVAAPSTVVEVPSIALVQHDISMAQIAAAIAEEVTADPAGDVAGQARVRTGVEKRAPEDIAAIVLRTNPDGSSLTVGDVATVLTEGVDRERAYFVGDDPAISVRVDRNATGDAIRMEATVREVAEELEATLPAGTSIDLIRGRAEYITGRLDILYKNGLMGLGLVVLLLFLFLNTRTAFWVAAGIPVAMTAAIALMYFSGLTINMISLFALLLTLGIVVDDAIVVGEHADARYRRYGEDPETAAETAATRMFTPVFSATLTTVIAFFGLTAISGRFGSMIADIPFTVIVVLAASLVECFLILPHHMSKALKERPRTGFSPLRMGLGALAVMFLGAVVAVTLLALGLWLVGQLAGIAWLTWLTPLTDLEWLKTGVAAALAGVLAVVLGFLLMPLTRKRAALHWLSDAGIDAASRLVNRGFTWVRRTLFRPFMAGVIWARYPVIAGAVGLLALQAGSVIRGDVQWRFFNAPEQGSITANFAMLPGATREDSMEMLRELQRATDTVATRFETEHGVNPLTYVIAEIGGNAGPGIAGTDTKDPDQLGAISIEIIDADLRPFTSGEFFSAISQEVVPHPMAETVSFRSWGSGPGGDDIDIQLFGADPETLKAAAEMLKGELAVYPEISALEDSLAYDKEELILELTPQGQALGFTIDDLGRVLRNRLGGVEAASYPVGTRSATVTVELPDGELTADFLERTLMRTSSGDYVPLADIVTVESRTGFSRIVRENGVLLISVTGDISDDDAQRATEVMQLIQDDILPRVETAFGVRSNLSGLSEQEDAFLNDARLGLIFVLTGIYLTLAWIFSSWTRPLVIMAIIPFGLVGTIWGHQQWDIPMSMFTVVGLLGMVGIIINDSIVLVTTIDEHARTRGIRPAIIDGAADRLRAVFLTTATTVLGLAPLLYEGSSQAEFLKPTVITLVYGLGFGVVLVLFLVPALIAVQDDVARYTRAARRGLTSGQRGLAWPSGIALAGVAALFAALIAPVLVTGAPLPALSGLPLAGIGMAGALVQFCAAVAVWLVLVFAVTGVVVARTGRAAA